LLCGNSLHNRKEARAEPSGWKLKMRVAYALQGLLAASTTMAASYNPQHVVLGTDGTVVVDVDPSLYFRPSKNHRDEVRLESERQLVEFDLKLPDAIQAETSELPLVPLPALHEELLLEDDFDGNVQVLGILP
jgi:hypothetical protein